METFDHRDELVQRLDGVPPESVCRRVAEHLPHGEPLLVGHQHQLVDGGLADAAHGIVDDALQGLLIARVHGHAQVGYIILDLLALVEADAAINGIGDAHAAQGFLERAGLRIGTVQYGEVPVMVMVAEFLLLYGVCYELAFIIVRSRSHQPDLLPMVVIGPQLLGDLPLVVADDLVGHLEDVLGGPVILLQFHEVHLIVILLELQDVLDGGPAEGVDGLRIVAHHAHVLVHGAQQFDHFILRRVGILVLIDQDVAEFVLVGVEGFGHLHQQLVELEQQVIEIHGPVLETTGHIGLVDLRDRGAVGAHVLLL